MLAQKPHRHAQAAATAWLIARGRARLVAGGKRPSAQNGEAREIRLHGGIVTGVAGVPAPRRLSQSRADVEGLTLARGQICGVPGTKTARGGARVAAQLQATQCSHRHPIRFGSLRHALSDVAREVLVVETVSIALRARWTNPLLAPLHHLLARAAQSRISERDRDTRQVECLAQRRLAALRIEQLIDAGEVGRTHPRAGGCGRCAMRDGCSRRVRSVAGFFAELIAHGLNPLSWSPRSPRLQMRARVRGALHIVFRTPALASL